MMTLPTISLEGQVALVTGGGSGVGRAIALDFARAGADVVVAGRRLYLLEEVATEVKALGRRALTVKTDISKWADVHNLAKKTLDEFGTIDILVNNAGATSIFRGPFVDHPEEIWDKNFNINFKGFYRCCQVVGKIMMQRKKGNIINIASIAAFLEYQTATITPYNIAKASMITLAKGLSQTFGPYNIRVNCIAPGYIDTALGPKAGGRTAEDYAPTILLGRVAQPSDISGVALFLASDLSSYITGETIVVDGGGYRRT